MKMLLAVTLATLTTATFARDVYVQPHVNSNGTYVERPPPQQPG